MERFQTNGDTVVIATEGKIQFERHDKENILMIDMSSDEMKELRNVLDYKLNYGKDRE